MGWVKKSAMNRRLFESAKIHKQKESSLYVGMITDRCVKRIFKPNEIVLHLKLF